MIIKRVQILDNQTEWERFEAEIKNQFSIFKELPQFKGSGSHIAWHTFLDAFEKNEESTFDVLATLRIIKRSNHPREIAVAGMLAFLWEYEGNYVSHVDGFCYLLTLNGHDLFDIFRRKYVKSLEDISNVDVFTKLLFLEEHGFGIINREEDRELRNKIAHHDFTLDASGKLTIKDEEVDIALRFNELCDFNHKTLVTLCSLDPLEGNCHLKCSVNKKL